jgi:hypothetical protein
VRLDQETELATSALCRCYYGIALVDVITAKKRWNKETLRTPFARAKRILRWGDCIPGFKQADDQKRKNNDFVAKNATNLPSSNRTMALLGVRVSGKTGSASL